jgi:hypothetical protein
MIGSPWLNNGGQFLKHAGAILKDVALGKNVLVDDTTLKIRQDICLSCEFLKNNRCSICGCACTGGIALLHKVRYRQESCPKLKWSSVDS